MYHSAIWSCCFAILLSTCFEIVVDDPKAGADRLIGKWDDNAGQTWEFSKNGTILGKLGDIPFYRSPDSKTGTTLTYKVLESKGDELRLKFVATVHGIDSTSQTVEGTARLKFNKKGDRFSVTYDEEPKHKPFPTDRKILRSDDE